MSNRREVPGIREYDQPAGGWGGLKVTSQAIRLQMETINAPLTLLRTNQPDGFDCPGCAWPDKEHKSTFQFCENGAKAVTWEATTKRVRPEFFAANTYRPTRGQERTRERSIWWGQALSWRVASLAV
jgi:hypothetical protein